MDDLTGEIVKEVLTKALKTIQILHESAKITVDCLVNDSVEIVKFRLNAEAFYSAVRNPITVKDVLNYVNEILNQADKKARCFENSPYIVSSFQEILASKLRDGEYFLTAKKCKILIKNIISKWKINNEWCYSIVHYSTVQDACFNYYKYKATFSIPCPSYPIPQSTASVYFTIITFRIGCVEYTAEIRFSIEGSKLQHSAIGDHLFNEDWLYGVLFNKINIFKRITALKTL